MKRKIVPEARSTATETVFTEVGATSGNLKKLLIR